LRKGIKFMARRITKRIPAETLQANLNTFREKALEWGATDAKIITADKVIIDERVRAKCMNPKCPMYGSNGNCPPYAPDLDMVRQVVNNFHYGIFVVTKFPFVAAGSIKDRIGNYELVARIEAEAFYSGYYLALGFADGPCKSRFCPDKECSVLTGQGCRMGLKARYSMESWGMNAYLMAAREGWEVYPIGKSTMPADVPYEVALGLVLIY
jgi:predicted metal-binding protein